MKILSVNAGSSSHKLSLFDMTNDEPLEPLWIGELDWGNKEHLFMQVQTSFGATRKEKIEGNSIENGLNALIKTLWEGDTQVIKGHSFIEKIGHRIVHGGLKFEQPVRIDSQVKESICELIPLAPLHNPANFEGILWMEKLFPRIPQFAVFDTAFHATMPEVVKTYPVPMMWKEEGIQRYGFHGISHQYCSERMVKFLNRDFTGLKAINCHLGNGCSLCAIKEGKSYETTMGLTPMEGLMMGTRCGSIDPGILLYQLNEKKMEPQVLDNVLNFSSGLKGICGSSDMRDILNRKDDPLANLAREMFVHRLKTSIGALTASLGGVDVLSFTGGIGENSFQIREDVCSGLSCLNVEIDREKNRQAIADMEITGSFSKVRVLVLHTREEWMIARACFKLSSR